MLSFPNYLMPKTILLGIVPLSWPSKPKINLVLLMAPLPNLSATAWCNHGWCILPSIANSILWITDTHVIWTDLHDHFFPKECFTHFEIHHAIFNCTQGTNAIATYYTTLKGFWDELSSYHKLPTCSYSSLKDLSTTIEIDHLMDFLQGLNDSYSGVRSQILLMEPLP
ncbi:hypothetical protein NE237_004138 [Protea cynaroides]|uniref:Retrotransposon gag domain-containing protein n=1 Tax=Protea cynaroides TaxID=273540 RepID=A0A9Q0QTD8_9MAGN|nr:hypothetical protein NE237_004138 [Protea cynaroides]